MGSNRMRMVRSRREELSPSLGLSLSQCITEQITCGSTLLRRGHYVPVWAIPNILQPWPHSPHQPLHFTTAGLHNHHFSYKSTFTALTGCTYKEHICAVVHPLISPTKLPSLNLRSLAVFGMVGRTDSEVSWGLDPTRTELVELVRFFTLHCDPRSRMVIQCERLSLQTHSRCSYLSNSARKSLAFIEHFSVLGRSNSSAYRTSRLLLLFCWVVLLTLLPSQYLETLCNYLYDDLYPRILHEPQLTILCEVCMVLDQLLDDDIEDAEKDNEFGQLHIRQLLQMVLQDAQTRLFFKAQVVIQSEIQYYAPTAQDLAYPDKLAGESAFHFSISSSPPEDGCSCTRSSNMIQKSWEGVSVVCSRVQGLISKRHGFQLSPKQSGCSHSYMTMFRQVLFHYTVTIHKPWAHERMLHKTHIASYF